MKKGPVTPKGFRDINPKLAGKRRFLINTICDVLENFGFVPIETPTIEFSETLTGKYGEEERLIYNFTDRGGRNLALRFDLTVPLARYVANNLGVLNPTFSRYQIGQVYRGEKPQRGRYREFTQLDFDTVGSSDLYEDARIIAATLSIVKKLGIKGITMSINDRKNFKDFPPNVIRAWDKYLKIGEEGVKKEILSKGYTPKETSKYIDKLKNDIKETKDIKEVKSILETNKDWDLVDSRDFVFDKTLARGLDYYTGLIFELVDNKLKTPSIGGGGRYDNLIGIFAGRDIPAVGFSFGIDRLVELID